MAQATDTAADNDVSGRDSRGGGPCWPRWLLAAAVLVHLAMFLSLFFGYLNPLFELPGRKTPQAIDFFCIYQAGTSALKNHSIYSWAFRDRVPYVGPYRYVPFFAYAVGVPLNALPPWSAYWLWVALEETMVVANAWLTYRVAPDRRWGSPAAALWLVFTPIYVDEYMGQFSLLMATLMLWTGVGLLRGHSRLAAGSWAASLLTKTNSALIGLVFLRTRQWRAIALAAATVVVLNTPYFLARRADGHLFWNLNIAINWQPIPRAIALTGGDLGGISYMRNTWLILNEKAQTAPAPVEREVVIAIIGLSLAATFLPRRPDPLVLFSIWSATFFWAFVSVWEHHYVMLLPALALLIVLRPRHRGIALVVALLLALPTPYYLIQRFLSSAPDQVALAQLFWPDWAVLAYHSVKPLPVLVFWGALVWEQLAAGWAERRSGGGEPAVEEAEPAG